MNKKQLIKEFDKQDFTETSWLYDERETYTSLEEVKEYIFKTIIPEVLKSVMSEFDEDYNAKKIKIEKLYKINL